MSRNGNQDGGSTRAPQAEPDGFAAALATEIATLRKAGFSKAYICERSFEIEDRVRQRLGRERPGHEQSDEG